jgi:sugar/nucleoside kinase (ribokinase family)/ubiquinone/menaquinone biosynthesis C-methylase UbiE
MPLNDLHISIGAVIIDDIILPDGSPRMGIMGGGSAHAVMGMRVWSENIGLISIVGEDFPQALRQQLARNFDLRGLLTRSMQTTRAWQLFETDGTRNEVFRTDHLQMISCFNTIEEFPEDYTQLKSVHLHCNPPDVPQWAEFLKSRGSPIILWEPWDQFCTPKNHAILETLLPHIDIFSPNLAEGRRLTRLTDPAAIIADFHTKGAPLVALRMGASGSLISRTGQAPIAIPAVQIQRIIDVTGAGNAYCGGLAVSMANTNDLIESGCCAAVSASFALEQFGALYKNNTLRASAQQRKTRLAARITNPRRAAFNRMADTWDDMPFPEGLPERLNRIAAAGRPQPNAAILDIGAGTGGLTPYLMAHQPGIVLSVDLSTAMLNKLQGKVQPDAPIAPTCADALHLPYSDASMDVVYCHSVFPHFTDTDQALGEIARVLKSDGWLVISLLTGRNRVNAIHAHHTETTLQHDHMPSAAQLSVSLTNSGWKIIESEDTEALFLLTATNVQ